MKLSLCFCLVAGCLLEQAPPKPTAPRKPLRVGDTCYATVAPLPLRARPAANGPATVMLASHDALLVREITNAKWVLVDCYWLDVGVNGYVEQRYLRRQ